ncbi:MAG: Ig domain-containing protein, partial [Bacteroidales bacterium]|nr:Ig domain-containing protein [Bacteroidales bacterium]
MKKFLSLFCVVIALASCAQKAAEVTSVTITPSTLNMTAGDAAVSLTAQVLPNSAMAPVTWSSSDQSVATVSNSGSVTPLKEGSVTITATAGGKSGSCKVTVKAKTIAVTGVSLDKSELTLTEGETETLKAIVAPDNATNKNISWKSSNTAIATIDNSGKVTAVKNGEATITVTTEDGNKTATCKVTVKEKIYPVESVSLDKSEISLTEGESETLTATIKPDNATNKNINWSSTDEAIATVDNTGKITAVKAGEATITVTTEDGGKTATCNVQINAKPIPVTKVSLDKTTLSIKEGESATLKATVTPKDATNKNVSWKSSDSAIATVDNNGKVTAVKVGNATITVTTEDGNKTATCKVTVIKTIDGHEYVDLDLPSGILWATCNMGASAPEKYGDYYGWGVTTPYKSSDNVSWQAYFKTLGGTGAMEADCGTDKDPLKEYVKNGSKFDISGVAGIADGIGGTEYDAARENWKGDWRMPTGAEFYELFV